MKFGIKILAAIALCTLTFGSCNSDDSENAGPSQCKLLKWNEIFSAGEARYQDEFVYENGRIIKRLKYGTVVGAVAVILSTDSIVYDAGNRVDKVYYGYNFNTYDQYIYNSDNSSPVSRKTFSTDGNGVLSAGLVEDITYDSNNRIKKTVRYLENNPAYHVDTVEYFYNDNNLTKKISTVTYENGTEFYNTTTFTGHDNMKNPFRKITAPLAEFRDYHYSKNNITSSKSTETDQAGNVTAFSQYERTFGYSSNDYPLIGTYDCE